MHALVTVCSNVIVALFLTVVLVLQPLWKMTYNDLIALWTIGAFLLGLGAPIAGWASDRVGETWLMVIFFLGFGASCVACGLADGPQSLQLALAAMGLFGAIYHPVGIAWVVKTVRRRGRSIAMVGISGSIGVAFASLIAGVLSDASGWRAAFIVPGLICVATGIALLALCMTGHVRERQGDAIPQPEPHRHDVRRAFAVLVVTMALTTLAYHAFTTMLPKWIGQEIGSEFGGGLAQLGAVVTVIYLTGASVHNWSADTSRTAGSPRKSMSPASSSSLPPWQALCGRAAGLR